MRRVTTNSRSRVLLGELWTFSSEEEETGRVWLERYRRRNRIRNRKGIRRSGLGWIDPL